MIAGVHEGMPERGLTMLNPPLLDATQRHFAAKVGGALLIPALCGACWGNTTTEFPPGLEPLEDNLAPMQDGTATEMLGFEAGEKAAYTWVHGRGYYLANPATVWAAAKNADLMADSCSTPDFSVDVTDDPDYELSFVASYFVDDIINVAWDEQWRFGTILGTPAEPELGMVRYQKVYGSELIQLIEGSIQVIATDDPEVTELALIEHVAAAGGTADDMRLSMQHRFDAVAAALRGDAHPPCP